MELLICATKQNPPIKRELSTPWIFVGGCPGAMNASPSDSQSPTNFCSSSCSLTGPGISMQGEVLLVGGSSVTVLIISFCLVVSLVRPVQRHDERQEAHRTSSRDFFAREGSLTNGYDLFPKIR